MAKTKKYDYVISRLEYNYKETKLTIMTKRQRLEKDIQACLNKFKDYDINYTGLLKKGDLKRWLLNTLRNV